MNFNLEKKQAIEKIGHDKSKKGDIDIQILPLVNKINTDPDYYTTSSCAGRILLIVPGEKKNKTEWPYVSHDMVRFKELGSILADLPEETMWFRMEHPIIHISCRDMAAADRLLKAANDTGFRRSALLTFSNRIIAEIMIPEKMDVPISEKGVLLVSIGYVKYLIKHANRKLKESRKKLKKLESLF
ncbi:MAG: tRNA wybutosine-synthesizing 3 family protein [Candidatus Woesearchaeota archaeon]|nr:tRNA wybutosine-synthesizing 3 family protein [Candidatus Woesearchaeota archaeon]